MSPDSKPKTLQEQQQVLTDAATRNQAAAADLKVLEGRLKGVDVLLKDVPKTVAAYRLARPLLLEQWNALDAKRGRLEEELAGAGSCDAAALTAAVKTVDDEIRTTAAAVVPDKPSANDPPTGASSKEQTALRALEDAREKLRDAQDRLAVWRDLDKRLAQDLKTASDLCDQVAAEHAAGRPCMASWLLRERKAYRLYERWSSLRAAPVLYRTDPRKTSLTVLLSVAKERLDVTPDALTAKVEAAFDRLVTARAAVSTAEQAYATAKAGLDAASARLPDLVKRYEDLVETAIRDLDPKPVP